MLEARRQYVENITGVRRVPLECFTLPHAAAAAAAAPKPAMTLGAAEEKPGSKEEAAAPVQPETYLEMARGSSRVWLRNVKRNASLQTQVAAFLLEASGSLSVHLPPEVREGLLKESGLWEAFCEGLGTEPVDVEMGVAPSGAAPQGAGAAVDGQGAAQDLGAVAGDSLVGMVLRTGGVNGLVVSQDAEAVEVAWDGHKEVVRVSRREASDMLVV